MGNALLSTVLAASPVVVLLGGLACFHFRAHVAALAGPSAALVIAIGIFSMPASMAFATCDDPLGRARERSPRLQNRDGRCVM